MHTYTTDPCLASLFINDLHDANCCCMFESVMLSACMMCPQFQPARSYAVLSLCVCTRARARLFLPLACTPPPLLHTYTHQSHLPFTQTTVKPIQTILRSAGRAERSKEGEGGGGVKEGEKRGEIRGNTKRARECVCGGRERGIRVKLQIWWPGFPVRTDLSSAAPSEQLSALQGE